METVRRLAWIFGLALMFGWYSASAEPMELTVRSYPPGAAMRDQFDNKLGRSGRKVMIDWSRGKGTLQLQLTLPGHKPVTRSLSYREIAAGVYPEDGTITLPPNDLQNSLLDLVKYRTGTLVTGILALLAVLGAVAVKLKAGGTAPSTKTRKVGRYLLQEKIGQGATAEVYRAVSSEDPGALPVALKLMKDSDHLDGQMRERFRREIKTSLSLQHPNLVRVYDWGEEEDGQLYLVTELLQGQTLREHLRDHKQPEMSIVCSVIRAVAQALHYLHDRGLVHRDVKPDNIFLTTSSEIKLMDLGITKGDDIAPLTRAGTAMGTPHYMAPEQINGQATPASDQYALGVLAFEMLSGKRPYRGSEGVEILRQHLSAPVPSLSQYRNLGSLADDAVARAMAKNQESRFGDVSLCAESLCAALSQEDGEGADTAAFTL